MKNKRCLILRDSIVLLIMIMICTRIVYVNTHVRMPEVHSVTQGNRTTRVINYIEVKQ